MKRYHLPGELPLETKIMVDACQSQVETLKEEIREYDRSKAERFDKNFAAFVAQSKPSNWKKIKKRKKQIRWHLIPLVGFFAMWKHEDQFLENNPFSNKFKNSDNTKDPFIFTCIQIFGMIFLMIFIVLVSFLIKHI